MRVRFLFCFFLLFCFDISLACLHRRLQRSVSEMRRYECARPNVSVRISPRLARSLTAVAAVDGAAAVARLVAGALVDVRRHASAADERQNARSIAICKSEKSSDC